MYVKLKKKEILVPQPLQDGPMIIATRVLIWGGWGNPEYPKP